MELDYSSVDISSSLSTSNMYLDVEILNIDNISGYYVVKDLSSSRGVIGNNMLPNILINSGGIFSLIFSPKLEDSNVNVVINSEAVPPTQILNIYPNPIGLNDNLYIDIESGQYASDCNIEIYNILGQSIHRFSYQNLELGVNKKITIPINKVLSVSGIYFIEININKETFLSKVVFIK